ncbi:LacI family DNA-binding transcriptional regulator [Streptomyces sp. NBS 14/10]|uniref:LacI family DNA-binding transcriptional regulator n=1 Tax=Streptomyces sp. NBS 14/10 TaxID=1945643 RepID=UPI000B7ED677|nr:LacI family DNA-binding transcriptional regulator [Streptomyces sp. NBS 14/10]KAK1186378.1 LacI family DNA-binding transcriptional regulator [Streptomyces sp. NBS 14/10]NUP39783.1 LacI family transcriptional regulator [Streptomyces sp.]NUS89873.1 LacI family transcriptional regulator [Streptomyces sp.]
MAAKGRVTIREVAERAGVSVATVSRVLSGNYPVPPATRTRVMRAAQALDYVANAHARALVGGGRKMVAVVLRQVTSPFYAQVAEGVEAEAAARGWLCLVGTTGGDPQRELEIVQLMREEGARLVILVGGVVEDDAYRERVAHYAQALDSSGARLVLCGRQAPDPDIPALVVEFDNEAGAHALTGHLLSAGHRRIVFLGGLPGNTALDARVAGYRAALAQHGLPPEAAQVVDCGLGRAAGHRAMAELLDGGTPEFTAVFAGDDMVAAGALRAIAEAGLRVPDDISVVGYNDIPLAEDFNPPLTTVRTPAEELGRAAVRIALRDPEHAAGAHHVLGTHIVVRDSVAAPPPGRAR